MVGESVPLRNDGTDYRVTSCGQLGEQLETFDSRHGVFCNFVMTPLLASIHALKQQVADVEPLKREQARPKKGLVLAMPVDSWEDDWMR